MTQIITSRWGWQWWGGGWDWDMKKAVYDPQNIGKDAFDYDNFTNTPTIPTEVSELDNDAWYITSSALSGYQTTSNLVTNLTNPDDTHYPSAKAVSDAITSAGGWDMLKSVYDPDNVNANAFDYNNFINTPTIPTVNNATLKIQKNGTDVATFTANASTGVTADISVPTKVSDLSNDSWFVTNQVDDTAYWSGWDWKTTKAPSQNAVYDKISAMDTTISSKAADSDVVKLTWNQTIAWTKTFSTSPVVPSKSTDATNTATAISTEAQVYKKQDKLTTQTAYTSKWTATKVPTITTNTLWQVTGITETDISFPVTSVNGSTWAVTVNDVKIASSAPTASDWKVWYDTTNHYLKYYEDLGGWDASWITVQEKLASQTAYTSKWTSTKVPTITTNTLWQVTSISETSIAFPVTSVNWNTWAVTISEGNTKTFYASTSSQWNTTLWQEIYNWIKSGNYAILQYWIQNVVIFTPTNTTTWSIYSQWYYTVRGSGGELESVATTYWITVSSWTVTAVDSSPTVSSVWDFFAPWGTATTGYVVTKTASGYEWAAPTGWIQVDSASPIQLTKIWAGTQAQYEALGSYDATTVYLTI